MINLDLLKLLLRVLSCFTILMLQVEPFYDSNMALRSSRTRRVICTQDDKQFEIRRQVYK